MEFTVEKTSYSIRMPDTDMDKIADLEDPYNNNDIEPLYRILERMDGVTGLDYDGWLGPHIFLTIDAKNDTEEQRAAIKTVIREQLEKANAWYSRKELEE